METISGYIGSIIFQNEENGYCVFTYQCEDEVPEDALDEEGEMTCVGSLPGISPGEYVRLTGDYTQHRSYGLQFAVQAFEASLPTDADAVCRYLASGAVKGIGKVLAKRIVAMFGDDTFRIMEEEPERLAEVSGISSRKAMEISDQIIERRDQREAMMLLGAYDIGQTVALRAYRLFGSRIREVLRENPYRLAEEVDGIGFETADRIAVKNGFAQDSDFRISCGMLYVLSQMAVMGHTYLPSRELADHVASLLQVDSGSVERLLPEMVIDKKVITKGSQVYLPVYYKAEAGIARLLFSLDEDYEIDEGHIERLFGNLQKAEKLERDEVQFRAVCEAAGRGVFVLTGGPGTGKTKTIRTILQYFEEEGMDISLCAPTGRAAKRMSEATGRPAQTIHRLLGIGGKEQEGRREDHMSPLHGFTYNAGHPLECDVVIVDEVSMVDVMLMYALVKAVAVGTRLILVGDVNQLPSVGPGNVLKDLIRSGAFSVVTLERIFRQSHKSDIVEYAHNIIQGRHFILDNHRSSDFFMAKCQNAQVIIHKMCEWLHRDKLPAYVGAKRFDVQILTPMRKGALGVERLNLVLQRHLNPAAVNKPEYEYGGKVFREGDKVMQIKNDYELGWKVYGRSHVVIDSGEGIFNGDMGVISAMDVMARTLTVTFDDERVAEYEFANLNELELAYAVTIHKSQGSEYPAVIIPLLRGPQRLYNRNLLYTAVTRAKKCVLVIGDEETFWSMVDNAMENKRYSGLKDRLEELLARREPAPTPL